LRLNTSEITICIKKVYSQTQWSIIYICCYIRRSMRGIRTCYEISIKYIVNRVYVYVCIYIYLFIRMEWFFLLPVVCIYFGKGIKNDEFLWQAVILKWIFTSVKKLKKSHERALYSYFSLFIYFLQLTIHNTNIFVIAWHDWLGKCKFDESTYSRHMIISVIGWNPGFADAAIEDVEIYHI